MDREGAQEDAGEGNETGGVLCSVALGYKGSEGGGSSKIGGVVGPDDRKAHEGDGGESAGNHLQTDDLALGLLQREESQHLFLSVSAAVASVVRGTCGGA